SVTGNGYSSNTIFYRLSATPTLTPVFDPNSNVLATATSINSNGSLNSLITLPVRDINLSVTERNGTGKIHWKITADEQLESITLEKSTDGKQFRNIYSIPAVPYSLNQYTGDYDDAETLSGLYFYRLKIVKADGSIMYSAIKTLSRNDPDQFGVSPNPVQRSCVITIPALFSHQLSPFNLSVYSVAGILLHEEKISPNTSSVNVYCESFPPGLYKVVLRDQSSSLQTSFLKK
ncbi:MAG: hypothetical protein ABI415_06280, partial [Flavitalea sp.]